MRCKNCGWPNKASETKCVKCNTPLSVVDEDMDGVGGESFQSHRPLNRTILEDDIFDTPEKGEVKNFGNELAQDENVKSLTQCPKCGYPLRSGVDKCPNCNFQIDFSRQGVRSPSYDAQIGASSRREEPHRRPTRVAAEGASDSMKKLRGTINPYMMNMEVEPSFVLKPVKRMEERHNFEEQEYEGKQVVLNRDNTESNNSSITSKEQAIISNVDGRWFIEDKSELKTTFVQAAKKIELHDGDIILLGNRLFEFHK